jgi:hypothetical protein
MNLSPDMRKKAGIIGAFVILMAGILYYDLRDDSPAPVAPAGPVVVTSSARNGAGGTTGTAARRVGNTATELDPTLKMGPMLVTESLVYSGSGRNIFSANSTPMEIPKAIAPARPKEAVKPVYTPPPGPPPPPPIDLKFFGTAASEDGQLRAFLLKGDDVFLASDGEIVQRRYRVEKISANSIVVEDLTNNNKQVLPLLAH